MTTTANIFIGVPHTGHDFPPAFCQSLFRLQAALEGQDILSLTHPVEAPELCLARNEVAAAALRNSVRTHLLMLDPQQAFEPESVLSLLRLDKDVAVAAEPMRRLDVDLDGLRHSVGPSVTSPVARAFPASRDSAPPTDRGAMQVERVPGSMMLVKRDVLAALACRSAAYLTEAGGCWDLFTPQLHQGVMLDGIEAFQLRVRHALREVWWDGTHPIRLLGERVYRARPCQPSEMLATMERELGTLDPSPTFLDDPLPPRGRVIPTAQARGTGVA